MREVKYPSLIRVQGLDRLMTSGTSPSSLCAPALSTVVSMTGLAKATITQQWRQLLQPTFSADFRDLEYCLLPAACRNIHLGLQGASMNMPQYFTTSANCFRSKSHLRGHERLHGFAMREIVCVGTANLVKTHLSEYRELIELFVKHLGLPVAFEHATDPFFDKNSA